MGPIHPMTVHFPIALLVAGWVAYCIALFVKSPNVRQFAFWLHAAGAAAAVVAILTGDYAENQIVQNAAIAEIAQEHETLGMITGYGFALLAVWSFLRMKTTLLFEKIAFVVLYTFMVLILFVAAAHGGELVYEHGAGVAPMQEVIQNGAGAIPE